MLFTGVAYSITAFPVLCRILTELKLLDTTVGIVVLSAGVGNDIVGWTLLALSVALVNAGSGLEALWILLVCVGWTLFLLFFVKRVLYWLARRTGSIRDGPSMFFMTVTILLLFGSAFFTDIIGVRFLPLCMEAVLTYTNRCMLSLVHFLPASSSRVRAVWRLPSPRNWKIWCLSSSCLS